MNIEMIKLKQGYGAKYANVYIKNNYVYKKSLNNEGETKLKNEIDFYTFIKNNKINFPIPKISFKSNKIIKMEYLKNYNTLEKYLRKNIDNLECIINLNYKYFNNLHNFDKIKISKELYLQSLKLESSIKIKKRYSTIKFIVEELNIKYVNNLSIIPLELILDMIDDKLLKYVNNLNEFYLNPIHGDLQLNNILIKNNLDIKFIDPRGYFGDSKIYGIKDYDFAKFRFGLTGYSDFDLKDINTIHLKNYNLEIDMNELKNLDDCSTIIKILVISIWLSNGHTFIYNKNKVITSYYYGIYLASKYLFL